VSRRCSQGLKTDLTLPGTDSFRATTCANEKVSAAALNPCSQPIVLYTVAQSDAPRGTDAILRSRSKTKAEQGGGGRRGQRINLATGEREWGRITGPWGRRRGCRATSRRRSCDPRSCDRAGRPSLLVRLLPPTPTQCGRQQPCPASICSPSSCRLPESGLLATPPSQSVGGARI